MSLPNNLMLAIKAADTIINNLADSDFVLEHGGSAIKGMIGYRLDIIGDIFLTFEGRLMTEDETTAIINGETE